MWDNEDKGKYDRLNRTTLIRILCYIVDIISSISKNIHVTLYDIL